MSESEERRGDDPVDRALRDLPAPDLSDARMSRIKAQLDARIAAERAASPGRGAPGAEIVSLDEQRRQRRRLASAIVAAAAAALLLILAQRSGDEMDAPRIAEVPEPSAPAPAPMIEEALDETRLAVIPEPAPAVEARPAPPEPRESVASELADGPMPAPSPNDALLEGVGDDELLIALELETLEDIEVIENLDLLLALEGLERTEVDPTEAM